jgi:hypothetical protein
MNRRSMALGDARHRLQDSGWQLQASRFEKLKATA